MYVAENPAEVITMYMEDDGQDIELPLPADMIERITYEVLRTEFGIKPTEHEVKIISDATYAPNDPNGTQRLIHNKEEKTKWNPCTNTTTNSQNDRTITRK